MCPTLPRALRGLRGGVGETRGLGNASEFWGGGVRCGGGDISLPGCQGRPRQGGERRVAGARDARSASGWARISSRQRPCGFGTRLEPGVWAVLREKNLGQSGGDECPLVAAGGPKGRFMLRGSVQGTPWPWLFQSPTSSVGRGSGSSSRADESDRDGPRPVWRCQPL